MGRGLIGFRFRGDERGDEQGADKEAAWVGSRKGSKATCSKNKPTGAPVFRPALYPLVQGTQPRHPGTHHEISGLVLVAERVPGVGRGGFTFMVLVKGRGGAQGGVKRSSKRKEPISACGTSTTIR